MMDPIKTSANVEFDVIYADGKRTRVPEGVLFEADGERMIAHIGTGRVAVLFAVAEALTEIITDMGLGDAFKSFIENYIGENGGNEGGRGDEG